MAKPKQPQKPAQLTDKDCQTTKDGVTTKGARLLAAGTTKDSSTPKDGGTARA